MPFGKQQVDVIVQNYYILHNSAMKYYQLIKNNPSLSIRNGHCLSTVVHSLGRDPSSLNHQMYTQLLPQNIVEIELQSSPSIGHTRQPENVERKLQSNKKPSRQRLSPWRNCENRLLLDLWLCEKPLFVQIEIKIIVHHHTDWTEAQS